MLGVEDRKERGLGSGGRDPVFTGPPVGRGVNRQPDLDVSPLPEPARWQAFHSAGPASIYIALRDPAPWNPPSRDCPETQTHWSPCLPAEALLHTVFGMSQVRTRVTSFSK